MTRQGDCLIIRPSKNDWSELEDLASEFGGDFMLQEAETLEADESVQFE